MDLVAGEPHGRSGLGGRWLTGQGELLEFWSLVLFDPRVGRVDPRSALGAELVVVADDGSAVVTHVSSQVASSRGRYSATVISIFLIRAAEPWTFGNVLGAVFLVSIGVLAAVTWWRSRE